MEGIRRIQVCKWGTRQGFCFSLTWINARCPPKPLCHSPSSAGQGRRNTVKGSRQGQGEITHQLPSQTNQTELGEKRKFNLSPIRVG